MKKSLIKQSIILSMLFFISPLLMAKNAMSPLDKINERATLRVGVSTFVPWAMRNKQGELIGFEIDVAKRLAKDSGWQVEFIPMAWDGIIPALLAKKTDVIISGMSVTPERAKSVLFTLPYSHSGVQVTVNKNKKPDVSTFDDLNSRRVKIAVRRGAYTVQVARDLFPKARLLQFDDELQAIQEVLNSNADAMIAATPKPEHETLKHPKMLYLPFKERLSKGDEAFAVRLGEDDKKAFFDAWIAARTQDGWLQERYDYWFSTLNWENQLVNAKP